MNLENFQTPKELIELNKDFFDNIDYHQKQTIDALYYDLKHSMHSAARVGYKFAPVLKINNPVWSKNGIEYKSGVYVYNKKTILGQFIQELKSNEYNLYVEDDLLKISWIKDIKSNLVEVSSLNSLFMHKLNKGKRHN